MALYFANDGSFLRNEWLKTPHKWLNSSAIIIISHLLPLPITDKHIGSAVNGIRRAFHFIGHDVVPGFLIIQRDVFHLLKPKIGFDIAADGFENVVITGKR